VGNVTSRDGSWEARRGEVPREKTRRPAEKRVGKGESTPTSELVHSFLGRANGWLKKRVLEKEKQIGKRYGGRLEEGKRSGGPQNPKSSNDLGVGSQSAISPKTLISSSKMGWGPKIVSNRVSSVRGRKGSRQAGEEGWTP